MSDLSKYLWDDVNTENVHEEKEKTPKSGFSVRKIEKMLKKYAKDEQKKGSEKKKEEGSDKKSKLPKFLSKVSFEYWIFLAVFLILLVFFVSEQGKISAKVQLFFAEKQLEAIPDIYAEKDLERKEKVLEKEILEKKIFQLETEIAILEKEIFENSEQKKILDQKILYFKNQQ